MIGAAPQVAPPPSDPPLRTWFFNHSIDPRTNAPSRRPHRALCWVVFITLLVAQNPMVRNRRLRAVATFWWCQLLRASGRPYEVRMGSARLVCPPWSALGAVTAATGGHEPAEQAFVHAVVRPGDGVIDVGANIGWYSIPIAARGVFVVAVEPSTDALSVLRGNIARSGVGNNVDVVPMAVSDYDGHGHFSRGLDAQNHLVEPPTGGFDAAPGVGAAMETIEVRRLDSLAEEQPDWFAQHPVRVLKIDAEGADEKVLDGAAQLIDRSRPIIMIETHSGGAAIRRKLGALGYRCCWLDVRRGRLCEFPEDWAGNRRFHSNVFGIPNEQLDDVQRNLAAAITVGPAPRVSVRAARRA